jgi:squalene-hopene/tetraprenyl-beta-curcumene cyclase
MRNALLLILTVAVGTVPLTATAAEPATKSAVDKQAYEKAVAKGIEFLMVQGQANDGSYTSFAGIGPTALITTALLRHGRSVDDPKIAKSLKFLESFVGEDGGIHQKGASHQNYETCLAIMCFSEANQDGRYDETIQRAEAFIKGIQWGEDDDKNKSDLEYGGGGYGRSKRPDLSNTSFLVDALKSAGDEENSEAMQRALIFISRCQNLETEHNTTKFAAKVNDGGFYYTAAAGGSSQAGETPDGGLRSYGSMTYAGLKSMLYAGVGPDDPRVKAAVSWVQKHYDVTANPGLGDAGLYYYYHVFSKALDALDQQIVTAQDGTKHDWRAELVSELANRQQENGSWVNKNDRWLEGDPNLATGFALLSLSYCKP